MKKILAKAMKHVASREEALELINEAYPEVEKEEPKKEPEVIEPPKVEEPIVVEETPEPPKTVETNQVAPPENKQQANDEQVEQLKKELAEQKVNNENITKQMNEFITAYNNNVPFGMTKKTTNSDAKQTLRDESQNSVDDLINGYNNGYF